MEYLKSKGGTIASYTRREIMRFFEISRKGLIIEEMKRQKLSAADFVGQPEKMQEFIDKAFKNVANWPDHEIFVALFVMADFYGSSSQICFRLKDDFDSRKVSLNSLEDLMKFRLDPPDFIIRTTEGLREFELKRYRDALTTDEAFAFIKKKIQHYCNDLGDMNLLLLLQAPEHAISDIDFHDLYERIKGLNFKFGGHVLIAYNENDKEQVVNTVYPGLTTARIPLHLPSQRM